MANSLRDSAELYRRWYWVLADDHQRDIAAEHRQLRDLALTRDKDAAMALLCRHIERAPAQLIAYANEHGVQHLDPAAPTSATPPLVRND
jgi:DNA-binding GntR family transcriptional regulator